MCQEKSFLGLKKGFNYYYFWKSQKGFKEKGTQRFSNKNRNDVNTKTVKTLKTVENSKN